MDTHLVNDFENIASKADFDSLGAMLNSLIDEKEFVSCHTRITMRPLMLFLVFPRVLRFDNVVGSTYKGIDLTVINVTVAVKLNPVFKALIKRIAHRRVVHTDFLDLIGSGFDSDVSEVVHIHEAEDMAENIEYKNGVVAAGKLSKRCFLRDALH